MSFSDKNALADIFSSYLIMQSYFLFANKIKKEKKNIMET